MSQYDRLDLPPGAIPWDDADGAPSGSGLAWGPTFGRADYLAILTGVDVAYVDAGGRCKTVIQVNPGSTIAPLFAKSESDASAAGAYYHSWRGAIPLRTVGECIITAIDAAFLAEIGAHAWGYYLLLSYT